LFRIPGQKREQLKKVLIFAVQKTLAMDASYLPVQYVHREVIEEEIEKQAHGKVFFFCDDNSIGSAEGKIIRMEKVPAQGVFIAREPEARIRIDRIITLFGKPAAAYDEYDAYANACLNCTGGYDPD
jgi:hypothetical protein